MKLFAVNNIVIHGQIYMRRYRIRTRWFGIHLHHIRLPDYGRDFHDHPFDFVSFVVKGSYWEQMKGDDSMITHRWGVPHYRRAEDAHTIVWVPEGKGVWTVVLRGPLRRHWGFYVDDEWVESSEYFMKGMQNNGM